MIVRITCLGISKDLDIETALKHISIFYENEFPVTVELIKK
jgi:hypothetical protein